MAATALKAIFLLGTLKPKGQFSHTETLCELVIEKFKQVNVQSEIIHLNDFNIPPGILNDLGPGDDWPKILKKVLQSDIIIFATPIWWGIQSSLIQKIIERLDELNEELLKTGKSELANKVGGIVITGAEDGAEHIIGNLCNFMVWNGLTLPPACSVSYLGDFPDNSQELIKKWKGSPTESMADTMTRNLAFFARLLKQNPLPQPEEGIKGSVAPGTVGMRPKK